MKTAISQSKFWVYSTAFIMSFNGGYINAICLASILKNPVGYVTGDLTLAGESLNHGQFLLFLHLIFLVICFLIGSIISGLVIQGQNFKIDRRYTISLVLQLVMVVLALLLLLQQDEQAGYLLALTMGMQNAMTTHYGSALIRTTHMTGTTTDLGIIISHWIKGYGILPWKIYLYLNLIVGFAFGAFAGAFAYGFFNAYSLLLCLVFYFFMMGFRKI